ncbi:LOW QUALITY PROTEIN: uncharacterized protein LOC129216650 [Uloborus diversus]|uniref:LOW QUALITY PROTEIN: uncharacterized protein LOC129216650 n=1 Tax=Uloborus diversus TaxID=327109 RepID=UPI00240921F0|nr:LOW QUALITY PROTEIN: uncharacterized protein LOC129216650 [Uloborus diversus]
MLRTQSLRIRAYSRNSIRKPITRVISSSRSNSSSNLASPQDVQPSSAKPFEDIPHLPILPFIGTAWTFFPIIGIYSTSTLHLASRDGRKRFGDICRQKIGSLNIVLSFRAEDMETLSRNEGPYPFRGDIASLKAYRESRKQWYSSTGLMILQGKEWHSLRTKTQKHLLKPKAVEAYMGSMQEVARDLVNKIYLTRDSNKEVPNFLFELYKWALESVAVVGLDTRLGCLQIDLPKDSDGMKMIDSAQTQFQLISELEGMTGNLPFWKLFPTPKWRKFTKAADVFTEIAFKYINRSLDDLKKSEDNEEKELTLLQALLSTKGLDASGAMVTVADMLLAGIDTTSHTIGFLLYQLAKNPDKQELLYQEIMKTLPHKDQKMTPVAFSEFRYLKSCLKESQRLHPIAGGAARVLDHDVVMSGYKIPAGTMIAIALQEVYRREEYYKNPHEFCPERWLEKDQNFNPFAFLPFGFGTRSCIGRRLAELEMITLTTEIIKNFKVEYHHEDIDMITRLIGFFFFFLFQSKSDVFRSYAENKFGTLQYFDETFVKKLKMLQTSPLRILSGECKLLNGLLRQIDCYKRPSSTANVPSQQNNELASAKPFEEIPHLPILPVIGTAWAYMPIIGLYKTSRLHEAARDKRKKFGDMHREKFGPLHMVASFRAEDMEILSKHEGPYPNRGFLSTIQAYRESRKQWYTTTGLMVLQGKEWHDLRSKTQKHLLKPKAIEYYLVPMQEVAKDLVNKIYLSRDSNKEVPNFLDELYKWSLESIAFVGLDTRLGCLEMELPADSEGRKMIDSVQTQFALLIELEGFAGKITFWKFFPTPKWRKFTKASDVFTEIAFKYINRALDQLKKNEVSEEKQLTLLQAMLTTKGLDASRVMVTVADMLFAGIDTTAHTVGFLLYHLAKNPDKQERLYQEVMSVLPSEEQKMTPKTFAEMRYLKCCMKESQRLHPVVGGSVRVLDHDVVMNGYRIPAGTMIGVGLQEIYRTEKYYKNPNQFNPERWLEKDENFNPFAFLPFGLGIRSCIGRRLAEQEVVTLTTEIIRNFKIEYHHEDIDMITRFVSAPDKPLKFSFIERR